MKNYVISKAMTFIKDNNEEYNQDKLDEIKYGLEAIYILVTKTTFIFLIAIYLHVFFEMLVVLLFYNLLRMFAFGIHASKGWICLIFSTIIFISFPFISKSIVLPFIIKIIILIITNCIFFLYAPSDTHKRPIVNAKKRSKYKIITIFLSLILTFLCLYTKNEFLSNAILSGMLIESLMINPLTYKLFKMPYMNYKTYIDSNK